MGRYTISSEKEFNKALDLCHKGTILSLNSTVKENALLKKDIKNKNFKSLTMPVLKKYNFDLTIKSSEFKYINIENGSSEEKNKLNIVESNLQTFSLKGIDKLTFKDCTINISESTPSLLRNCGEVKFVNCDFNIGKTPSNKKIDYSFCIGFEKCNNLKIKNCNFKKEEKENSICFFVRKSNMFVESCFFNNFNCLFYLDKSVINAQGIKTKNYTGEYMHSDSKGYLKISNERLSDKNKRMNHNHLFSKI